MNIFHIGTIALEADNTKRELKSIGGISGYIIELINYAKAQDHEISFVGKIYNYNSDSGIHYYQVQEKVSSTNKFLINLLFKSVNLKVPENSVIHAHRPDHLAAFLFFNNRPSVVTLHGQQALTVNIRKSYLIRKIYHHLEKYALKKANRIIAVDPVTEKFYEKLYPRYKHKMVTIPTGVNTEIFFPNDNIKSKTELGYNENNKLIIYVGRIEPPKKVKVIIEAFSHVLKEDSSFRLLLVGDGVSREEMERVSENLKVSKHVSFLGIRRRNELPQLYNAADVSILISGNEGSPLSVKESLACGTPVVANDVGDINTLVENNYNGFIVNSEDINEIAQKLITAANKKSEFKQNCINSIQPYTIPAVSKQVLNLYKEIVNE